MCALLGRPTRAVVFCKSQHSRLHIPTCIPTFVPTKWALPRLLLPPTYTYVPTNWALPHTYLHVYLHTSTFYLPNERSHAFSRLEVHTYVPTNWALPHIPTCIPTYFYLPNERSHIYLPTCIPTYLPNERSHAFSRLHRYLCTYILTNQLSAPTYLHVGVLLKNLHVFFHHNFKKKLHVFLDGLSTVPCCGCVGQKFTCLFSIDFFQKCTYYTAYISIIFYERIFNLHKHSNSIRAYYYQTFIKLSNQYLLIAIFEYSLLELFKATQYPSSNRVLNRNWNTYQLKWIHIRLCLRSRHRQNILFLFQNGKKPKYFRYLTKKLQQ